MSAILLRFLPHGLVILAIGFAIWWIDDNAADRTRAQIEQAATKIENQTRSDLRKSEQRLAIKLGEIGASYEAGRTIIERTRTELQPIITREIIREPRLSDPDAGITERMREAINGARALSTCARGTAGGIVCPLPDARPADRPDDSGTGPEGL